VVYDATLNEEKIDRALTKLAEDSVNVHGQTAAAA
jgi:hypothetical protein